MEQKNHTNTRMARFSRDESGAVTVDWVVLTGAIILLGFAMGFMVSSGVPGLANSVADTISDVSLTQY